MIAPLFNRGPYSGREPMSTEYPYFRFYPRDWLSSSARASMTPAERGAYLDLLAFCWDLGCRLPADEDDLANLAGFSRDQWKQSRRKILRNFVMVNGTGGKYLTNRRLLSEREKVEALFERQRSAGSRGAAARWGKTGGNVTGVSTPKKSGKVSKSENSEIRGPTEDHGKRLGLEDGDPNAIALRSDAHTESNKITDIRKKNKKKGRLVRPASLIAAAKEFIRRYQNRDNFQCSDATITKKFFALVDDGIHTPEAILWLLEEWEKSAEWRKGFVTAPDKFLSKSNPKFRKPPRDVRQTDPDWNADGFETFKSE